MKFSVIIVNDGHLFHTKPDSIQRVLNALAAQTQKDFEVLLAGFQPSLPDARFKVIDQACDNPLTTKNSLANMADGEWLWLLTPRSYPAEECLESLYAATLRHPDTALFAVTELDNAEPDVIASAGKCYFFAGIPFCGGKGWPLDVLADEGDVFGATSPSIFVRKDAFLEVQGFDTDYIATCEDADLSYRLRLMGHRAVLASEAIVFTSAASAKPELHRMAMRNIITTFVKNAPAILFWLSLPFHVLCVLLLICSPRHMMARADGVMDALTHLPTLWKKRKAIQPTTSLDQLLSAMTWNPNSLFWHKTHIRRIKPT